MDSKSIRERVAELKSSLAHKNGAPLASSRNTYRESSATGSPSPAKETPKGSGSLLKDRFNIRSLNDAWGDSRPWGTGASDVVGSSQEAERRREGGGISLGDLSTAHSSTPPKSASESPLKPPQKAGSLAASGGSRHKGIARLEKRPSRRPEDHEGRVEDLEKDIHLFAERSKADWRKHEDGISASQAAMDKGIMAREQIEDGNSRDFETLRTNLEALLELAVAPRQSRFDDVASLIDKRVEDLGNVLRERARQHDAAHRRLEAEAEQEGGTPVGWSAIKQRAGPGLRARIEQHEAALEFSRSKNMMMLNAKLNTIQEELLREKTAREEDEVRVQAVLDRAVGQLLNRLSDAREQRHAMEVSTLSLIQQAFKSGGGGKQKKADRKGSQ